MILFPNAKINLGLDILRRRPDGYHDICTLMVPTTWQDVLELTPAAETELVTTGRTVACPPEKNLVMKAFRAMEAHLGRSLPGTRIQLHKIIPDGAGLGGGSADAAFTLLGLNELWQLGLTTAELERIAAGIGADCPFFIANTPKLCTGTGTTLEPISAPDLSRYRVAIVKPPFGISTAEAYAAVHPHEPAEPLRSRLQLPVEQWQGVVVNDFEDSVVPNHPEIQQIKLQLRAMGAVYSAMSGSGSAVFGIFPASTANLADRLAEQFPLCLCHA
jgi:4-diphosphocytidyl-2-C-methyl-D-erythritol kinase